MYRVAVGGEIVDPKGFDDSEKAIAWGETRLQAGTVFWLCKEDELSRIHDSVYVTMVDKYAVVLNGQEKLAVKVINSSQLQPVTMSSSEHKQPVTNQVYPGLQKIIDHLESIDNTENSDCGFDMATVSDCRKETTHPCGSACCIGGHAAILQDKPKAAVQHALSDFCDIPDQVSLDLCYPGYVRGDIPAEFENKNITLDEALFVLRRCRDTGVVSWEEAIIRQMQER